jgi:hypothetical protein
MSSSRRPRASFPATLFRSRSSCGSVNATASCPEWTNPQSISSVAATRPISDTVRKVSRSACSTAASPWLRAYTDGFAAMKADTQPPFRPDGPNPAISRSTTATRRSGCCAFR